MLRRTAALGALGLIVSLASVAPASAQNLVYCSPENSFCRVPYPTTVYYGYRGAVTARQVNGGVIPCNNRTFGDPAPGVPKACSFVARGRRVLPRFLALAAGVARGTRGDLEQAVLLGCLPRH